MTIAVCHLARDIRRTGGGEVVRQLAAEMDALGVRVRIVTDTPRSELSDLPVGVQVVSTPLGGALLRWSPRMRAGWHVRHAAQIAVFTVAGSLAASRLRRAGWAVINHNCEGLVGEVVVMHNVFSAELRRRRLSRLRLLAALANPTRAMRVLKEHLLAAPLGRRTFVAVSTRAVPEIEELTKDRHAIRAIPNAIDLDRFRLAASDERAELRQRFEVRDGTTAVAFIGHEFKRKGLPELIASMPLLPESFELFVAGGASQNVQAFRAAAESAGVLGRVHFLGTVHDTPGFLRAMDVFCLPSHYEGTPMVALEALATGLPAVLSRHCPVDELLEEGVNGFACEVEPEDVARQLLAAAAISTSPGAVRSTVEDRTWRAAAQTYLEVVAAAQKRSAPHRTDTPCAHGRPAGERS